MKLLLILTVTLALSLADEIEINEQPLNDLVASASGELPTPVGSRYGYVPQTTARPWDSQSNYNTAIPPSIPSAPVSQNTYFPVQSDPPQNLYYPQNAYDSNTWDNQNSWNNPQNSWNNAPSNSWNQNKPQNSWGNQQSSWNNPQNTWTKPQNTGSQNTWTKPQNTENTNNWSNWNQTPSSTSSTTTPIPVIKNEQTIGENGSYKYEYEIADGTHVAEEGYFLNPNTEKESLVKKGFYSFTAADGKVYSVTYWADETGFHAVGDHLPKPPPVPPAIQASIEQNAKEEAEKNQHQQGQAPPKPIIPQQPIPVQKPVQPVQQPTQYPQQIYYPQQQQPQQTYYPPTNYYPPQSYGRR